MKISKVRGPKATPSGKKTKKIADTEDQFADQLREVHGADEVVPSTENTSVTRVESVLALQESSDSTERKSRAIYRDYGKDLLDRLEQLRMGILAGVFSKDRLAKLAQRLREKQKQTNDPYLNEIIKEIELRAEIEIAKLTRNT